MGLPNPIEPEFSPTSAPRAFPAPEREASPLAAASGWAFVLFAAVAVGYGLWALYGSGERVAVLNVIDAEHGGGPGTFGPVRLEPGMSPVRVVLHTAYTPTGSTRLRYEVAVLDANGQPVLERRGALGNKDDEASLVKYTTSLGDFTVGAPGAYGARVAFDDRGMDDLREATLEMRRNAAPVDARITWGFGTAALASLLFNLLASRGRRWAYRPR